MSIFPHFSNNSHLITNFRKRFENRCWSRYIFIVFDKVLLLLHGAYAEVNHNLKSELYTENKAFVQNKTH